MNKKIMLLAVVLALGLCVLPITNLVVSYATMSIDRSVPGVEIKYYHTLLSPQSFRIIIENVSGQRYPTTISIYTWLPNGSITELGMFLGRHGDVKIDVHKVIAFLKSWYKYLLKHGNNPLWVKPGIIILGAVHTPLGVYSVIKGVPLSIAKILRGLSAEVRIVKKMTKKNVLIPINEVNKLVKKAFEKGLTKSLKTRGSLHPYSSSWPPRVIIEGCYPYSTPNGMPTTVCFIWNLDKVYASMTKHGVPLVATYIYGSVEEVKLVHLKEVFRTYESRGIYISFGIVAAVKSSNGEISYEVPGFTIQLGGDRIWLDYAKSFYEGIDFSDDAIVAIGIWANLSFAKYELWSCIEDGPCVPAGIYANMTLAEPYIENNELRPWGDVDTNPYDGVGELEKVFHYIRDTWNKSKYYITFEDLDIDSLNVEHDLDTSPLFSTSIAILPLLLEVPESLPFTALASISVGVTREVSTFSFVECYIVTKHSNDMILAQYSYSPVQFEYKGKKYRIGSLYIDTFIYIYSSHY